MKPVMIALSRMGERRRTEYLVPKIFPKIVLITKAISSSLLTYFWISSLPNPYFQVHSGLLYIVFMASVSLGAVPEYYSMVSIRETIRGRKRRLYDLFYQICLSFELDPRFSERNEVKSWTSKIKEKACIFRQIRDPPGILIYLIAIGISMQLIPMPEIVWSISMSLELLGLFTFFSYVSNSISSFTEIRRACLSNMKGLLNCVGIEFEKRILEISPPHFRPIYPLFLALPFLPPSALPLGIFSYFKMVRTVNAYNLEIKEEGDNEEVLGEILSRIFRSQPYFLQFL